MVWSTTGYTKEPRASRVITLIDYVLIGPLTDDDPMSRVKYIVALTEGGTLKNEGEAFARPPEPWRRSGSVGCWLLRRDSLSHEWRHATEDSISRARELDEELRVRGASRAEEAFLRWKSSRRRYGLRGGDDGHALDRGAELFHARAPFVLEAYGGRFGSFQIMGDDRLKNWVVRPKAVFPTCRL